MVQHTYTKQRNHSHHIHSFFVTLIHLLNEKHRTYIMQLKYTNQHCIWSGVRYVIIIILYLNLIGECQDCNRFSRSESLAILIQQSTHINISKYTYWNTFISIAKCRYRKIGKHVRRRQRDFHPDFECWLLLLVCFVSFHFSISYCVLGSRFKHIF